MAVANRAVLKDSIISQGFFFELAPIKTRFLMLRHDTMTFTSSILVYLGRLLRLLIPQRHSFGDEQRPGLEVFMASLVEIDLFHSRSDGLPYENKGLGPQLNAEQALVLNHPAAERAGFVEKATLRTLSPPKGLQS